MRLDRRQSYTLGRFGIAFRLELKVQYHPQCREHLQGSAHDVESVHARFVSV